jgi:hypothetical protein
MRRTLDLLVSFSAMRSSPTGAVQGTQRSGRVGVALAL